ncbi:MAG: hypothetical protein AAGK37_05175 [Pseudomonadota bacterium]
MSFFNDIRTAARKRSDYSRTLSALSRMPQSTVSDLGLEGKDLRDIARRAVYGV